LAEAEQEDWLNMSRFDVAAVVRELADVMSKTFHREVRAHTKPESVLMYGDKDKVQQLLLILIDNAIKYSKEPIDVRVRSDRTTVKIEVTDYGIGIPESEIPFLFERFYRVDEARQRATGGSGLGLSIAKRIVDLHEGSVEVFSKPGVGTTVALTFRKKME
jgi:signal transduction histidine kinase